MKKLIRSQVAMDRDVSWSDQGSVELEVQERMRIVKTLDEPRLCDWGVGSQQNIGGLSLGLFGAIHTVQHILHDLMTGGKLVVLVVQELVDEFLPAQRQSPEPKCQCHMRYPIEGMKARS